MRPRLERSALAPYALFLAVTVLAGLSALEVVFHSPPNDFRSFYAAAKAASAGLDYYDQATLERVARLELPGDRVFPYLYPPLLAHALRPLVGLELPLAHAIWLGAGVLAFACAVAVTVLTVLRGPSGAATHESVPSWSAVFLVAAVLVCALPLRNNVLLGQVNPIVLLFISLAVRAHLLGKPALAGAWLAPAILIKVTPVLLLLFFAMRRQYRALTLCAACSAGLALATLPFGSAPDWISFVRHLPERSYSATIPGLFPATSLWNFAPSGWLLRLLPEHRELVPALSVVVIAFPCLIAMWLSARATDREQESLALATFFPVLLLASPLTYLHHVVYLLPAVAIWLAHALRRERHGFLGGALVGLFAAGTDWAPLYAPLLGADAPPLLTSMNLYAVLALLLVGWLLAWRGSGMIGAARTLLAAGSRSLRLPLLARRQSWLSTSIRAGLRARRE